MTHPLYTPSTARSPKVISFEPLQRGADAAERTRHSGPTLEDHGERLLGRVLKEPNAHDNALRHSAGIMERLIARPNRFSGNLSSSCLIVTIASTAVTFALSCTVRGLRSQWMSAEIRLCALRSCRTPHAHHRCDHRSRSRS
jgi:hypothetical protein